MIPLKPIPRVGTLQALVRLPSLWRNPLAGLMDARAAFGDIVSFRLGNRLQVFLLSHPDYICHVLRDNYLNYRKPEFYKDLKLGFGQGLLTADGEHWRRQRRMMQPFFNHNHLRTLVPLIAGIAGECLERWEKISERADPVNIEAEMVAVAQAVIVRSLLGVDLQEEMDAVRFAFLDIAPTSFLPRWLPSRPYRRLLEAYARLERRVWGIIEARRASEARPPDLLSMFLQARDRRTGLGMSPQQLYNEIITLIFAGTETTAQTLTWAWVLLSQHPQEGERMWHELDAVLGSGLLAYEDIPRLPFTAMVIDETLRLYPPSWSLGRVAIGADCIDGHEIPAGANIILSQYIVHRHPDFWEAPDAFRPERFTPSRKKQIADGAYWPFGLGPRNCIGREMALLESKIILAVLARRFRPRLVPGCPVEINPTVVLKSRSGIQVTLERRMG